MTERIINLDINEKGAWRRITSFDLDMFEDGDLEHCAHSLLELSQNKNIKARLIIPGDTAPLMYWSHGEGWTEWRAAA
jgi:hypothetical protein